MFEPRSGLPARPKVRTRLFIRSVVALAAFTGAAWASAQAFPAKPVRFIVPFSPGGGVDVLIRTVAKELSEQWKQPVIVENKPGAGGIIGAAFVSKSAPDGYTLLATTDQTVTTNRFLYKSLPYDPDKGLAPVTLMVRGDHFLLANPELPAKNLKELVTLARAKPVSYGSFGAGTQPHLTYAALAAQEKLEMVHVPYKGVAPVLTGVIGGEVSLTTATAGVAGQMMQAGRIKPLAFAGARRSAQFPDVPTTAEQGFPQIRTSIFYAVFAPPGTPEPVVARINHDINSILARKDFAKQNIEDRGLDLVASTPEALTRAVAEDVALTGPMVKAANIQPE
ncbi:MAG: tripartite tricarboxylate transporter substrate binding protein [Comamonadaceae bacterium]|nr:MAG: tripartite tricarboxylate transporter substrate binding protein [Comamonadaceae bacterium]